MSSKAREVQTCSFVQAIFSLTSSGCEKNCFDWANTLSICITSLPKGAVRNIIQEQWETRRKKKKIQKSPFFSKLMQETREITHHLPRKSKILYVHKTNSRASASDVFGSLSFTLLLCVGSDEGSYVYYRNFIFFH